MITAMLAARQLGADSARVLHYANSGDVSGSKAQVVGYLAAALYSSRPAERVEGIDTGLSAGDKELLHQIARTAIESKLRGEPLPAFEITSPVLKEKRGGFVTLKKQGRLRGCIGYIQAVKPLYQTVEEMALAAAFNDHRFPPLRVDELPELELEISVLTPLEQIRNIQEIEVGRHGLYLQRGGMSGLLLPQVATEYNWDRLTFLQQTCLKAGLPPGAWQDEDTRIYTFSADIF
jgi:AmmeMemoRadiSam system protein A